MTNTKRPRVAAIGLDDTQLDSIAPFCGMLRRKHSLRDYVDSYSWTETDVVVSSALNWGLVDPSVNIMTIGPTNFYWVEVEEDDSFVNLDPDYVNTGKDNTERELSVPPNCPDFYRPLAVELSRQLALRAEPPSVIETALQDQTSLIETSSGHPVAVRIVLNTRLGSADGAQSRAVALLLPELSNLTAWFSAFLKELHESDPSRVPQAPPRLSQPSDWHTPEENALADHISEIESKLKRLANERDGLQAELSAEGEKADSGIRQALWADGDDLVAGIKDVLAELGFTVRDIDAELKQNEPKREDLRLTLQEFPDWEAIVEVKGYPSGTKTNDARQIRQHRERYITEVGRLPDLTIWLSNEYRTMDPSSRPVPDQNVKDAAELIGTVHVLASDLYRQWSLVAAGRLDRELVIKSLRNALPGLWTPPASDTGA